MARIRHIAISTQDPDKTARFYIEGLGLKEVGKLNSATAEGYYLSDGHVNVAILKFKSEDPAITEGAAYTLRSVPIRSILLLVALVSLVAASYALLMPVFAEDILRGGPRVFGYLMSATGVGALAGAIILPPDFRRYGKPSAPPMRITTKHSEEIREVKTTSKLRGITGLATMPEPLEARRETARILFR